MRLVPGKSLQGLSQNLRFDQPHEVTWSKTQLLSNCFPQPCLSFFIIELWNVALISNSLEVLANCITAVWLSRSLVNKEHHALFNTKCEGKLFVASIASLDFLVYCEGDRTMFTLALIWDINEMAYVKQVGAVKLLLVLLALLNFLWVWFNVWNFREFSASTKWGFIFGFLWFTLALLWLDDSCRPYGPLLIIPRTVDSFRITKQSMGWWCT